MFSISRSVSASPSSSAWARALTMSLSGSARRAWMMGVKYSSSASPASIAAARSSGLIVGSRRRARRFDQDRNRSRSLAGTPSISAITMTGSGYATASMRSKPAGSTSSRRVFMRPRMWGSRALTARRVNALLTRARNRVWSGGSRNSMV